MSREAKRPSGEPSYVRQHVNLKVQDQDGNKWFFTMKRTALLQELMKNYCNYRSVEDNNTLSFMFNGRQLTRTQTPDQAGLKNGDIISAVIVYFYINVILKSQTGNQLSMNINPNAPIQELLDAYSEVNGTIRMRCPCNSGQSFRFVYLGRQLDGRFTAAEYGMQDGSQIHAILRLSGC